MGSCCRQVVNTSSEPICFVGHTPHRGKRIIIYACTCFFVIGANKKTAMMSSHKEILVGLHADQFVFQRIFEFLEHAEI
jgi:hypothetical protein